MSNNDQIAKMAMSLLKLSNEPAGAFSFSIASMIESSDLTQEEKDQMTQEIIAEMSSGVHSICEKYKKTVVDLKD